MITVSRLVVPVVLLAIIGACSARSTPVRDPTEPTYVRVANQSWLDMNVYVVRSSERIRLGTVNGNRTERFTLPRHLVASATSLRFLADPIGSTRVSQSFDISVSPGDEVTLTIPPGQH